MSTEGHPVSNKDSESIISSDTTDSGHSANADQPLAHDNVPTSYTIGGKVLTAPLVDLPYLKTHLRLLRAFKDLRIAVEADRDPCTGKESQWPDLAKALSGPERWKWFVGVAVDRFQAWIRSPIVEIHNGLRRITGVSTWIEDEFPPIDVLMVWYAYMLNPMWYSEDCDRLGIIPSVWPNDPDLMLQAVMCHSTIYPVYPLTITDVSLDVDTLLTYQPSESRGRNWSRQTNTEFNPFDASASSRDIECPRCLQTIRVSYLTTDDKGYLQAGFTAKCSGCGPGGITKERLAMLKFARDAVADPNGEFVPEKHGLACYQAGTLCTERDLRDRRGAADVKDRLRRALATGRAGNPRGKYVSVEDIVSKWSLESLTSLMHSTLGESIAMRIMSAYTDDRPFSIDLVSAVSRQCAFIDKIHDLGWTAPGYFDHKDNETILMNAMSRYHAFLDLHSANPPSLFIPTLDIDLIWHTHQLQGPRYHHDCFTYLERSIDHPDKIEKKQFSNAFEDTCRTWSHRFGVPYTYCGCPIPGATIGERLRAVFGGTSLGREVPRRLDVRAATHVSEHNAEFVGDYSRCCARVPEGEREENAV